MPSLPSPAQPVPAAPARPPGLPWAGSCSHTYAQTRTRQHTHDRQCRGTRTSYGSDYSHKTWRCWTSEEAAGHGAGHGHMERAQADGQTDTGDRLRGKSRDERQGAVGPHQHFPDVCSTRSPGKWGEFRGAFACAPYTPGSPTECSCWTRPFPKGPWGDSPAPLDPSCPLGTKPRGPDIG